MKKEKKSDNWTITHDTGKPKPLKIWMRWMTRRFDFPTVLAIESESFEFPWLEEDFIRCLRQHNSIGMVAEHDGRVVGFMIYELNGTRIHVLNFAVASNFRRRGVGTQMLSKLTGKLPAQRRTRIVLEVRETNLVGQQFFRAQEFRAVGIVRDYYESTPEDAYLMEYRQGGQKRNGYEYWTIPQNRIASFLS